MKSITRLVTSFQSHPAAMRQGRLVVGTFAIIAIVSGLTLLLSDDILSLFLSDTIELSQEHGTDCYPPSHKRWDPEEEKDSEGISFWVTILMLQEKIDVEASEHQARQYLVPSVAIATGIRCGRDTIVLEHKTMKQLASYVKNLRKEVLPLKRFASREFGILLASADRTVFNCRHHQEISNMLSPLFTKKRCLAVYPKTYTMVGSSRCVLAKLSEASPHSEYHAYMAASHRSKTHIATARDMFHTHGDLSKANFTAPLVGRRLGCPVVRVATNSELKKALEQRVLDGVFDAAIFPFRAREVQEDVGLKTIGQWVERSPRAVHVAVLTRRIRSYAEHQQLASIVRSGVAGTMVGLGDHLLPDPSSPVALLTKLASHLHPDTVVLVIVLDGNSRMKPLSWKSLGTTAADFMRVNGATPAVVAICKALRQHLPRAGGQQQPVTVEDTMKWLEGRAPDTSSASILTGLSNTVGQLFDHGMHTAYNIINTRVDTFGDATDDGRWQPRFEVPIADPQLAATAYDCTAKCRLYFDGVVYSGFNNQREHLVNLPLMAQPLGLCGIVLPASVPYDGVNPYPIRPNATVVDVGFHEPMNNYMIPDRAAQAYAPLGVTHDAATFKKFVLGMGLCVVDSAAHLAGHTAQTISMRHLVVDPKEHEDSYGVVQLHQLKVEHVDRAANAHKGTIVFTPWLRKNRGINKFASPRITLASVVASRYHQVCRVIPHCVDLRTRGLVPRKEIATIIDSIRAKLPQDVVAFHLRLRGCAAHPPLVDKIADRLHAALPKKGGGKPTVYILAEVPPTSKLLRRFRTHFTLVTKDMFMPYLNPAEFPVETLAYIDTEIASMVPLFFGSDLKSSFFAWAQGSRALAGLPTHYIPISVCQRRQGKELPRHTVIIPDWRPSSSAIKQSTFLQSDGLIIHGGKKKNNTTL